MTARLAVLGLSLAALLLAPIPAAAASGRVVDSATGTPIAGATVTIGDSVVQADAAGAFHLDAAGDSPLQLRAPGYGRKSVTLGGGGDLGTIGLTAFSPRALYLSSFGVTSRHLREAALALAASREINALVIDVKGDRGLILHHSAVPLATEVGAQKVAFVKDIKGLVAGLKQQGLYLIARIVVFKDDPLANSVPALAVRSADGGIWHDRERLAWVDPFRREVWDYNIAIAVEAAESGFDEIQFDYVRFPDSKGLVFSAPSSEASRTKAIGDFLALARTRLAPYNVFLASDIFGYVCWNTNDTFIGQQLEKMATEVDYLSPMLYPSGFQFGIPGYRQPVDHPYEVVHLSLEQAKKRTGLPGTRFRPWLQSFKDYGFDRRRFEAAEIAAQVRAANQSGTDGWMLWNPHNVYSDAGLGN
jgi:hypothetical protein